CSCGSDGPKKCMGPSDCKANELCAADGRCVPGAECVDDTPCVAQDQRKKCDLTTFTCVFRDGFSDECSDTKPCAFGQFCSTLLGRCLDAASSCDCVRRGQCPSGQTCDRRANKCIPDLGCYGDDFCEAGELCDLVNHVCRAIPMECATCFSTGTCTGS